MPRKSIGGTKKLGDGENEPVPVREKGHKDGPLPLVRAPDFHKLYATRAVPFITDYDVRIVVANETMETEGGWCTIADGALILTPVAAKELAGDLQSVIQSWEELHGTIKGRTKQRILTEFKREGD